MPKECVILIVDDDIGHARLIEKNLRRAGLHNPILRFENGQTILDYLFSPTSHNQTHQIQDTPHLLLLDIRMPQVDGIEVLTKIKNHSEYRKIPIIMLTTTDDPREISRCYQLGCNNYIVKPVDYSKFTEAITQLGFFISLVQIPEIHG